MKKRKRLIKNIQYVLDLEHHFYHWVLNLEFKHSKDEYKLNPSEMRFLLEVIDFYDSLRFSILNARFSKANKKVDFENALNIITRYINLLKNEEYRKRLGINTNKRIQAWINYISSEEYLKKLEEIKAAAKKEKVIKLDKVQKKRKTVKTGQAKMSEKKKTSVKSKSVNEVFFNLSPKEIKHTVVEMPAGIGMSSYLEKLWKEGKL